MPPNHPPADTDATDPSSDDLSSDDLSSDDQSNEEPTSEPSFTIVGIGASAGGLSALRTLLAKVPAESGVAFVVVVHLSPDHESRLAELIQPHCPLPVQQVGETVELKPDHVYVIPPNANLNSIDTHLRLSELEADRRERAPVDHFFRTLAQTHDGHSIGIILTGTGSDGTLGLRRIKEQGGLTIAQDPSEAEHDGMPRSAIASGMVDLVLPLAEIPEEIVRFAHTQPRVPLSAENQEDVAEDQSRLLQKIFAQIRARTGHDFSHYKRSTMLRRIQRRMQIHHVETLAAYLDVIRERREEPTELFHDLLITVTEFFRDEEVFARLQQDIVPAILEGKKHDDRVRVWSVGCATGEEAYSLAMILMEEVGHRDVQPMIQVFASDLHERALGKAREGVYPEEIASDVSQERLERFFVHETDRYRIKREVRELVVFAPHSLLSDPPFSHLDLIVCRNLLIYLQRDVQQDVIALFHYALNPGGRLLLGTSETIDRADLFICEDKETCAYRKRDVPPREPRLPVFPLSPGKSAARNLVDESESNGEQRPGYGNIHEQMVERYAPPSVLVNSAYEMVHASTNARRFLQVPGGEPTSSVFKLIREPLLVELRAALHAAAETHRLALSKPIGMEIEGERRKVAVHVHPATDAGLAGFYLVIFAEWQDTPAVAAAIGTDESSATAIELHAELDLNRQRLQAMIEEYESSREEMKASNEELQSANEELRSTMEELETSKEELQSMNEELATLNQENRHRVEELSQLTSDLSNLMAATDIATLFLDRKLRIVRFTPQVRDLFNVRNIDRGRPLSDLTHCFGDARLQDDAAQVLDRLVPIERELQRENGDWFLTRVLPYRGQEDRIEGVVVTMFDITRRKQAEQARRLLASIVESSHDAIISKNLDGIIRTWNSGAERLFGYQAVETVGRSIDLLVPEDRADEEASILERLRRDEPMSPFETVRLTKDGRRIDVSLTISPVRDEDGKIIGASKVARDITDRKQAEEALRLVNEELESRVVERTAQLEKQTLQIRELAHQLATAEQEERQRLASHLHDDLQQLLIAASFHVRAIGEQNNGDTSHVESLDSILREAVKSCRQLTRRLCPPVLFEEGLISGIHWLASDMQELHGLQVRCSAPSESLTLPSEVKSLLFMAVRELLFNIVKHADCDEATVDLRVLEQRLRIRVQDVGCGFDIAALENAAKPTGLGLFGIRERLEGLGGELHIDSLPGEGSTIDLIVPLA